MFADSPGRAGTLSISLALEFAEFTGPRTIPRQWLPLHLLPAPLMKAAAGTLPPTATGLHPEIRWETEI